MKPSLLRHCAGFAAAVSLFALASTLPAQEETPASPAPADAATEAAPAATPAAPAATDPAPVATVAPVAPVAQADKAPSSDDGKQFENSVVRVFATQRAPDLLKPWTKLSPREVSGSGIVIEGKRILTNAHIVTYASQVQIQGNQSGDKLLATVEFFAPQIDLAVLKLEDESFFDDRPPIARDSTLPQLKQNVMAYGFPTGGTTLSITKGIVSRIEFVGYGYPTQGLRIQIDAAINAGNSGGPAMSGDKMIGMAFSGIGGSQSIGYIIPCEEIDIFLKDIQDGSYDGKPGFYHALQTLENGALRPFAKIPPGTDGILVNRVESDEEGYPLQAWDLITHIGEAPVDNQGMIRLKESGNLRIRFGYLIQQLEKDGKVPLSIIRKGLPMNIELPVPKTRAALAKSNLGQFPSYFIYGPLVFSNVTSITYAIFGSSSSQTSQAIMAMAAQGNPLIGRRGETPAFPDEELVFIPSPFFSHRLSKGYSKASLRVVSTVNGVPVRNLKHLVELLRDSKEEHTVICFAGRGYEMLVFPHKEMIAATEQILSDNGIRAKASADLIPVWKDK